MFKKMFSSALIITILSVMLPLGNGVVAFSSSPSFTFYGEDGVQTDSYVVGNKILMSGVCPILTEEGSDPTVYVMTDEITMGESYDTNVGTYAVSGFDFSDVEIMTNAVAGTYRVAIDTDGSGTATSDDCLADVAIKVDEYGMRTATPAGTPTNEFFAGEDIYLEGSCYPNKTYDVHVVSNTDWEDGTTAMSALTKKTTVTTDAEGNFALKKIMQDVHVPGAYDVVLDQQGTIDVEVFHPTVDCALGLNTIGFYMYEEYSKVVVSYGEKNPEAQVIPHTDENLVETVFAFDVEIDGDEDSYFKKLKIVADKDGDDRKITSVILSEDTNNNGVRDDGEVAIPSVKTYTNDNGEIEFVLNGETGVTLETGHTYHYLLTYEFNPSDFGNNDRLQLLVEGMEIVAPTGDSLLAVQVPALPMHSAVITMYSDESSDGDDSSDEEDVDVDVAPEFTDIAGHEFETYIEDLRLVGVVNGKSEGIFAPNDLLNRAEMTKMASLAFGYTVPASVSVMPFPDVEISQWYATYVTVAKTKGIVNGYPDGTFQPANNVNRVEALKIVIETSKIDYAGAETVSFPDTVEDWYTSYLNYAIKYDLVDPYSVGVDAGLFKPGQFATRGEAAKMISQMMAKVEAAE